MRLLSFICLWFNLLLLLLLLNTFKTRLKSARRRIAGAVNLSYNLSNNLSYYLMYFHETLVCTYDVSTLHLTSDTKDSVCEQDAGRKDIKEENSTEQVVDSGRGDSVCTWLDRATLSYVARRPEERINNYGPRRCCLRVPETAAAATAAVSIKYTGASAGAAWRRRYSQRRAERLASI